MDVKEAIEFLKLYKWHHIDEPCPEEDGINQIIELLKRYKKMWGKKGLEANKIEEEEIIDLLQQGEKYKQMVDELENFYGNGILENEGGFGVQLKNLIEILKQKYSPKGVPK